MEPVPSAEEVTWLTKVLAGALAMLGGMGSWIWHKNASEIKELKDGKVETAVCEAHHDEIKRDNESRRSVEKELFAKIEDLGKEFRAGLDSSMRDLRSWLTDEFDKQDRARHELRGDFQPAIAELSTRVAVIEAALRRRDGEASGL